MHTGRSVTVKKGDTILIRGYSKIEENVTEFSKKKQFTDMNGKKDILRGHKCSRPDNIYYEGKYFAPGTNSKRVMISYNHLKAEYNPVYIPTLETFCGNQIPTACRVIKLVDTIAYLQLSIKMRSQRSNTISQYSYNVEEHCPEPSVSDVEEQNGEEEEENKEENQEQKGQEEPIPKQKNPVVLWNSDEQNDISQFCQRETERFFNKDFDRTTRVQKKIQTANKIVSKERQKAFNSIKPNHRSPISFATKVIFCLKYENGMTNKDAWEWCKKKGFKVGKSHTSCHRWSQKGSQYWLKKLAESGTNGQKLRFNIYTFNNTNE